MPTLAAAALAAAVACTASAATLTVHPDGRGAYPTIQAAIDAAETGDVVSLADGVFVGEGNLDLDFRGKAITLGSASGDRSACVIDCTYHEARIGIRFMNREGPDTLLRDLTIANANAGAIRCSDSSPRIERCDIVTSDNGGNGGGVALIRSNARLSDCRIQLNTARHAGGVYIEGGAPVLERCDIRSNFAYLAMGGGVLCSGETSAMIRDTRIADNATDAEDARALGGGVAIGAGSSPRLERCEIVGNMASGRRGGDGGGIISYGSPEIVDCTITGNAAYLGSGGGALLQGSETITRTRIQGNSAEIGGGLTVEHGSTAALTDCLVAGNLAQASGGGLYVLGAHFTIARGTIASNRAVDTGGGVHVALGAVELIDSIIGGSCTDAGAQEIWIESDGVAHLTRTALAPSPHGHGPGGLDVRDAWTDAPPELCDPAPCSDAPTDAGDYGRREGDGVGARLRGCD